MAHAMVELGDESVIAAINAAKDGGHTAKIRVPTLGEQRLGDRGSLDRTSGHDPVCNGSDRIRAACRPSRVLAGTDIEVCKAWQVAPHAAEVADREHSAPPQFMFQRHIRLMNLGVLQVLSKESDARLCTRASRLRSQNLWKRKGTGPRYCGGRT